MTEEQCSKLIAAIIALSDSVDELTTEIQQVRDSIDGMADTIKTTEFHD